MFQEFEVTEDDIKYAEAKLLPPGYSFDPERVAFIRDFRTLDLQAVPGSGKTTALLAKLLILERKLPFSNGSGILVISHTNSAIDEIRDQIYTHCPKLFSYPNFIGTIQSFVDGFLAIPCGHNILKTRFSWIDKEKYEDALLSKFNKIAWAKEYGEPTKWFFSQFITRAKAEAIKSGLTERTIVNQLIDQEVKSLYYDFMDNTIKSFNTSKIVLKTPDNPKFIGIKKIILEVLNNGIISYQYAYCLANLFLKEFPIVKEHLQKRFTHIFVDEMQDMDEDQYSLLESVFYDNGDCKCNYQRIGDKNQAIYHSVKEHSVWIDRKPKYTIRGSQRLSSKIAHIVNQFAIDQENCEKIIGLKLCDLKPHILVYENETIERVVPYFQNLVKTYILERKITDHTRYSIHVISWNAEWKKEADLSDKNKIRLVDYYKSYKKDIVKPKSDYDNLYSYLVFFDRLKKTLEPLRKNVLNALAKILRLEDVFSVNQRYYTKKTMLEFITDYDLFYSTNNYEILKLNIYNWSIGILNGDIKSTYASIKIYIPLFLKIFNKTIFHSSKFINELPESDVSSYIVNSVKVKEDFKVSTVHSAKGQTHCATLYLESYYNDNYESEILRDAFLFVPTTDTLNALKKTADELRSKIEILGGARGTKARENDLKTVLSQIAKISQAAKMVYVGLSRPTNLLCIAIHKDRLKQNLSQIDVELWDVHDIPIEFPMGAVN